MSEGFADWLRARSEKGRDFAVRTALAVFEKLGWEKKPPVSASLELAIEGRRHPLAPGTTLTIGRSEENAIVLPDQKASAVHARLEVDASGSLRVSDLGSTNGTFVNDARLTAEKVLSAGDRVFVGLTMLEVVDAAPDLPAVLLDCLAAFRDEPGEATEKRLRERFAALPKWLASGAPELEHRRRALAIASTVWGALKERPSLEGLVLLSGRSERLRVEPSGDAKDLPALELSLPAGELALEGYRVFGELACGSWGALHWAWDEKRDRPVLLEELDADAARRVPRFRTLWPLTGLAHPNIERVLAVLDEGVIVRELAAGADVLSWLATEPSLEARKDAALALLGALEHAHAKRIVHGDIHLRRVLVDLDAGTPVLGGFGRSFLLGQEDSFTVAKDMAGLERVVRAIVVALPDGPSLRARIEAVK